MDRAAEGCETDAMTGACGLRGASGRRGARGQDELTDEGSRKWVERSVDAGCLKATLQTDGEASVPLEFNGGFSFAPDSLHLILSGPGFAVPVRQDFKKLTLTNCVPLRQVRIYWANYRK